MAEEVTIEALRPFNRTPQGDICEVGDRFKVDAERARQLELAGLAKRVGGVKAAAKAENKAAPAPQNKMAAAAANKGVTRTPVSPKP